MVGNDFKDLSKTTAADKLWYDKTFNVAKNKKYDTYQRGLEYLKNEKYTHLLKVFFGCWSCRYIINK